MPKALSELISDDIYAMIAEEKRFAPGDKLPNEIAFSEELNVNRATLRVAIRILVTRGVLEIKRGKGTYVLRDFDADALNDGNEVIFSTAEVSAIKDLYEMRLIIEPEAAFIATKRGTEKEIANILKIGAALEEKLKKNTARTHEEQEFHKAIAKATHNEYINKIMPMLVRDISKAVLISCQNEELRQETIRDHRLIMDFVKRRDCDGAKAAMRLHMLNALKLMVER